MSTGGEKYILIVASSRGAIGLGWLGAPEKIIFIASFVWNRPRPVPLRAPPTPAWDPERALECDAVMSGRQNGCGKVVMAWAETRDSFMVRDEAGRRGW